MLQILIILLILIVSGTHSFASTDWAIKCETLLQKVTLQEQRQRDRDLHYLMNEAMHVLTFAGDIKNNYTSILEKLNRINRAARHLKGEEHRLYGNTLKTLNYVLTQTFPTSPAERRVYFSEEDSGAILIIGELINTFSDVLLDYDNLDEGREIYNDKVLFYIAKEIKETAHYLVDLPQEQVLAALNPLLLQIEDLQEARRTKMERLTKRLESDSLRTHLTVKLVKQLSELAHEDYIVDLYYRSVVQLKNIILLYGSTIDEHLKKGLLNVVYDIKDRPWFHEIPSVMLEEELYKEFLNAKSADHAPLSVAQFRALVTPSYPGGELSAAERVAQNVLPTVLPHYVLYRNLQNNALNVLVMGSRVRIGDRSYVVQRWDYLNEQLHLLVMRPLTQSIEWVNIETTSILPDSSVASVYDDLSFN